MLAALLTLPNLLPAKWQPFAKAIYPAFGTVGTVIVSWFVSGQLNETELAVAVTGLLFALVAWRVPNEKLDPARKALYPALLALVAAAITWLATGDAEALRVAFTGLAAALVTYAVPNLEVGTGDPADLAAKGQRYHKIL